MVQLGKSMYLIDLCGTEVGIHQSPHVRLLICPYIPVSRWIGKLLYCYCSIFSNSYCSMYYINHQSITLSLENVLSVFTPCRSSEMPGEISLVLTEINMTGGASYYWWKNWVISAIYLFLSGFDLCSSSIRLRNL